MRRRRGINDQRPTTNDWQATVAQRPTADGRRPTTDHQLLILD
jgi:hypothetical protein